jgi:hypothetical protein
MGQECTFILPNGQKCRCIACRNQDRCRHHAPKPSAATPRPLPKHLLFSRHRRWSSLGREIPTMHPTQAPTDIYDILLALLTDGEQGISDREAGRLLRGLLRLLGSVPFPAPLHLKCWPTASKSPNSIPKHLPAENTTPTSSTRSSPLSARRSVSPLPCGRIRISLGRAGCNLSRVPLKHGQI